MRVSENIFHIDDRPMEIIPIEERKEKFKREIGPDMDRLTPEQIKKIKKSYMID